MSCCDNRYAPLTASGELTTDHLDALRTYAATSKPVYRANCPPGYTHCARAFDKTKPETVANNKLWFIDGHGHLCMPKCGWGSTPELRIKDKAAQMVRSGEIDSTVVTPEKIQAAAAQMQCDPCGTGKKNVSRAANMLSCTLRDLKRVDDEIQAKVASGKPMLSGGMGMGGCWSRSMSGGGGSDTASPSPPSPSLAGGARTSAVKCQVKQLVQGKNIDDVKAVANAALKPILDKKEKYHTDKLFCKLLAFHQHTPFIDNNSQQLFSETNLQALALTAVQQAMFCAVNAPLVALDVAKAENCVPASCYSQTFKIDDTSIKNDIKKFKLYKALFDTLICLFADYKKVLKLCEPDKAEEERIWKCKFDQAFTKVQEAGKCIHQFNIPIDKDGLENQVKTVAALKCDEPNVDANCTGANGKRVCSGTSMVCIPAQLAGFKDVVKELKKDIQQKSLMLEYQKVVIADLRRTLHA